ncbi:MAG: helix-turn-helix transcriptional regulator [Bacteroidales bacterium]|nr:helix-turn-helix transcriptional regulator [Bacteroidales bacterium]
MENIHEQFEQTVSLCHYGDDIYLLDEGQPLGELMPLVSGREIMTDKIVFLMCRSGLLHIRLNYHELSLVAGQVLIALPGMIIDTLEVSPDFRATTMLLSERFTDSLNLGSSYRIMLSIQRQPVVTLMAGMEDAMLNFVGMIRGLLTLPSHPNLDRVVHLLFESWFFGFGPYLHSTESQRIATAAEMHTEQFLRLVEQNFRQQHSIGWYASQMNITPKRLSICVKQTSGSTATQWIDRHRLHESIRQLRSGKLTVKEISSKLGFPNQSAFGTWFKRLTNTSPSKMDREHL